MKTLQKYDLDKYFKFNIEANHATLAGHTFQHELRYDGLDVKVNNIVYEKDPFGQLNTITLSLSITNMSKISFSTFDVSFFLKNSNNANITSRTIRAKTM